MSCRHNALDWCERCVREIAAERDAALASAAACREVLRWVYRHDQLCGANIGGDCGCGADEANKERTAALSDTAGQTLLARLAALERVEQAAARQLYVTPCYDQGTAGVAKVSSLYQALAALDAEGQR